MKLLIYISKLYSIPVVQPLIDYLDNCKDIGCLLLVSEKVKDKLNVQGIWQNKKLTTSLSEAISYDPEFCLSPGNFVDFRLPGIKVGIFHGIGVEKESHYKIRHIYDVYLTSGPLVTERYEKLKEKHRYFLVKETGWLKVDHILNYPADSLREKFGYPEDKKIILYAPTFSSRLESGSDLIKSIPANIKEDEFWLVKFHELMNKRMLKILQDLTGNRLRIIDDYDITPYLHIADVMISDTSSVLYEFMLLDKPVITYRTAKRKDKGIDISHFSELRNALDRTLKHPEENSDIRKRHIEEINPYLDGNTPERIITALREVTINNELPAQKKPINLRRKAKVIYREIKRKGL